MDDLDQIRHPGDALNTQRNQKNQKNQKNQIQQGQQTLERRLR